MVRGGLGGVYPEGFRAEQAEAPFAEAVVSGK
jgi:hypothetical protein